MAPPKASDGGRSVRLSLSFGPVTLATFGKLICGLSNSDSGVGEQEAQLSEFALYDVTLGTAVPPMLVTTPPTGVGSAL